MPVRFTGLVDGRIGGCTNRYERLGVTYGLEEARPEPEEEWGTLLVEGSWQVRGGSW